METIKKGSFTIEADQGQAVIMIKSRVFGLLDQAISFRALCEELRTKGHKFIAVDLSEAESINQEGIGALLVQLKKTKEVGGKLVLCSCSVGVHKKITETKLQEVFSCFDSQEEALASFTTEGTPS